MVWLCIYNFVHFSAVGNLIFFNQVGTTFKIWKARKNSFSKDDGGKDQYSRRECEMIFSKLTQPLR